MLLAVLFPAEGVGVAGRGAFGRELPGRLVARGDAASASASASAVARAGGQAAVADVRLGVGGGDEDGGGIAQGIGLTHRGTGFPCTWNTRHALDPQQQL